MQTSTHPRYVDKTNLIDQDAYPKHLRRVNSLSLTLSLTFSNFAPPNGLAIPRLEFCGARVVRGRFDNETRQRKRQ